MCDYLIDFIPYSLILRKSLTLLNILNNFLNLINFFLNNIFGLTLSGTETDMNSIIRAESVGSSILNGGSFGIEASIVTAAVYAVCAGLLYFICRKKTAVRTTANEGGLVYGL